MNKNKVKAEQGRDEVAKKAYPLYRNEGRQPGHDLQNWLTAETQDNSGHKGNPAGKAREYDTGIVGESYVSTNVQKEYICPMHPQSVRAAAGNCSICGMILEPTVTTATSEFRVSCVVALERTLWVS